MKESLFIDGLIKQKTKNTKDQITLWENSKIWKRASNKIKYLLASFDPLAKGIHYFNKNSDDLLLEDSIVLKANLIKIICKHLSIKIKDINTIGELYDLGEKIERKTIDLQKEISDGEFNGDNFQDLIQFNIRKMFNNLSKKFDDKSKDEQDKIVDKIMNVLEEMPQSQREKLKEELNINQITKQKITKAISTGTIGAALIAIVNIAGFSAYTFAVNALAAISGTIGITLPFGVYSSLTSIMAALANPYLLIPASLGLGHYLTNKGNIKIHNALTPPIITQIAINASKDKDTFNEAEILISEL